MGKSNSRSGSTSLIPLSRPILLPPTVDYGNGTHSHPNLPPEVVAEIQVFLAVSSPRITDFMRAFRNIPGILDLYEHHEGFRGQCDLCEVQIRAGIRASRDWYHAYVVKYATTPGAVFTIWTDYDLDRYDDVVRTWASRDLFS